MVGSWQRARRHPRPRLTAARAGAAPARQHHHLRVHLEGAQQEVVTLEDMLAGLDAGQYAQEYSALPGFGVAKPPQLPGRPRM